MSLCDQSLPILHFDTFRFFMLEILPVEMRHSFWTSLLTLLAALSSPARAPAPAPSGLGLQERGVALLSLRSQKLLATGKEKMN